MIRGRGGSVIEECEGFCQPDEDGNCQPECDCPRCENERALDDAADAYSDRG